MVLPGASSFEVPVAFFVFNRPEATQQTFETIAGIRPRRLFLIADGPRIDRPGEAEACAEVRRIVTAIDWPCDVATDFSTSNMGCGLRMFRGIDWVFRNVDEAILIEDDCVASPQFFDFCGAMLERYRHDTRVGIIGGTNCMIRHAHFPGSYFFSRYPHVWGWATWRRSWALYDYRMANLAAAVEARMIETVTGCDSLARFWYDVFYNVQSGRVDTWDYQLFFTSFCNSWLNVIPTANLISNIGCGPQGTHCTGPSIFGNLPLGELEMPLQHPDFLVRCKLHDDFDERHFLGFAPQPVTPAPQPVTPAPQPVTPAAAPSTFKSMLFSRFIRGAVRDTAGGR